MTLAFDDALTLIADRTAALRAAVGANEDAPVSSCPGWTGRDLALHLAAVHRSWATVVAAGPATGPPEDEPEVPTGLTGAALRTESEDALAALLDALRAAGPDCGVWSWWGAATSGAIARHQVQEASVHAWDSALIAGSDAPGATLPPAAALDGVDEFLTVGMTEVTAADWKLPAATVVLAATEVPDAWVVRVDGRTPSVRRVAVKDAVGDVTIRGSAADLVLALFRRVGLDMLAVDGNREVAECFVLSFNTD